MLKPLGDRVVVKVIEEKEKTVGGFVIAGASQEKTKTAEVVAVGEGVRTLNGDLVAPSVQVGQTILMDSFSGTDVKYDEQDYMIIRESDILAIVE
ncbi:co-chaperone GroES [Streptococcus zalophi]|uniref:co-chaperone GroES n=1 Tax=Streptococcus zalophi TaxID=640031 RepID=UPI00215C970D|nr:co-chaperone GroES [Streptococcus zalophi]MCR8968222.1 co-chaperone GroES [Streptococcus zalophi]